MSEVRSQKSEVRSQKSEVRSQKSEVRSQKSEVRSQKDRCERSGRSWSRGLRGSIKTSDFRLLTSVFRSSGSRLGRFGVVAGVELLARAVDRAAVVDGPASQRRHRRQQRAAELGQLVFDARRDRWKDRS